MANLKSLKFDELIYLAKHVSYIKPDKEYENWTEDEILFHTMYLGINNNCLSVVKKLNASVFYIN